MAKRFISGVNDFQPTPEELSWQRKTMPPPVDRGNVSFSSAKIPAPPQTPPLQAETPGFADEAKARARAYQAATKAPTGGLGIEPTAPTTASGATGRLLSGVKSLAPLLNPGVAIAYDAGQTPIAQEMRNDANRRLAAHGLKAMFAQPEAPATKPTSSYTPTLADTGITVPVKSADKGYVQFRTDRQLPSPQDNVRPEGPTSLGTVSDGRGTREYSRQGDTLMVKGPDGQLRESKWAQSLKPPTLSEKARKMGAVSDFWANMGLKGPDEYVATRSKQEGDVYKARLEAEAAKNQLAMQERLRTDALEKAHQEHQDRVGLREAMVGARQADDAAKAETELEERRNKNVASYADILKGLGWNDKQIEAFRLASPYMAPSIARSVGKHYGDLNEQDLSHMSPYLKQNINNYLLHRDGKSDTASWLDDVLTIGDSSLPVSDFAASVPALTARQLQSSKLKPEERAAIGG